MGAAMRVGQLRQRVTIKERVVARNGLGEEVVAWSDVATVWASVEPVSGNERWIGQMDVRVASRTTRIRMRYRTGITEQMRVVYGEQVMDVRSVINPWSRGRELWLVCEDVDPAEA